MSLLIACSSSERDSSAAAEAALEEPPTSAEDPVLEEPAAVPNLILIAASDGSSTPAGEPLRKYLARRPDDEEWSFLCMEVSGAAADTLGAEPLGSRLEVLGAITEIPEDEFWHSPAERHCRVESVISSTPGYSPHLPGRLGPIRGGMDHVQVAAALGVEADRVPSDTGERVHVVAGWGIVMSHDHLQFAATLESNLPNVAALSWDGRRVDLSNHMCQQPGWVGRSGWRHGWVEHEGTGARVLFASPGVKASWYNSYICGAARRLTDRDRLAEPAPDGRGPEGER